MYFLCLSTLLMLAYAVCSPTCDPTPDVVDFSIDWIQESLVQECVVLGVRTTRIVECWRRRRLSDSVEDDDDDSGSTGKIVGISVLGIVFVVGAVVPLPPSPRCWNVDADGVRWVWIKKKARSCQPRRKRWVRVLRKM